ncbi:hypothetical protein ACIBJF_50140 [Streptomyces sp. NPDC050743]|uniref:hypothetical protein n=1 Tax=Streptomyces sp. NPDC050743 TaxID=3365634 RepID=UPI0037A3F32A
MARTSRPPPWRSSTSARKYVHRLRHDDAESGPAAPLKQTTMLFLTACREYLGAEAEQRFGLRPTGRSLFARLSTR